MSSFCLHKDTPSASSSRGMLRIDGKDTCPAPAGMDEVSYLKDLRVMAIDSNPVSLLVLTTMLRRCQYKVTAQAKATEALEVLRQGICEFDIVVTAMVGLDMNGLVLLKIIVSELDIPVIIASACDDQQIIMRAILHGARDFILKPVRIQVLQNIWQHVMRRQLNWTDCWANNDSSSKIKKKLNWTAKLHSRFVDAVQQLGIDSANPKQILAIMEVEGLTIRHVSSHLQKYRRRLRELNTAPNQWSQGGGESSQDTKRRRCCDAHRAGRAGPSPIINQVSACTVNPSSVDRPTLQEYRPYVQRVQTPWFEHQPSAGAFPMVNQVSVPNLQGLGFSTAQFEHMQPGNQIGSHSGHFHLDARQHYRPPVQAMSVDHPHMFLSNGGSFNLENQITHGQSKPGENLHYCESSHHDNELTVLIDQFNVNKVPEL